MTIIYTDGDILMDPAEAIVIPVNTVGVPGAGLAKAWAKKDPDAASVYESLCEKGLVEVGEINITPALHRTHDLLSKSGASVIHGDSRWIIFPTKEHWKHPSRLEWIEQGLKDLQPQVTGLESLAVPALGCGFGGLEWDAVRRLLEKYLTPLSASITIYPPKLALSKANV